MARGVPLREGEWGDIETVGRRAPYRARVRRRVDGEIRWLTASGPSRAKAVSALEAKMRAADGSGLSTMDDLLALYLEHAATRHCHAPRTVKNVRDDYGLYIAPTLGRAHPATLTPRRIEALLNSSSSPGHAEQALRPLLREARIAGVIESDPFELVRPPTSPTRRRPTLVPDDVIADMEAAMEARASELTRLDSDPMVALDAFTLLRETGARIGELCAWRAKDADAVAGLISIRGTMTLGLTPEGREQVIRQTIPKTEAGYRTLTLPPEHALGRSGREVLRRRVEAAPSPDSPLIPARGGKFLSPNALRRRWRQALEPAGLAHINPHLLRHTVATHIVRESVRAFEYAEGMERARLQLGHASVQPLRQYLDRTEIVVDNASIIALSSPQLTRQRRLDAAVEALAPGSYRVGVLHGRPAYVATATQVDDIRASGLAVEVLAEDDERLDFDVETATYSLAWNAESGLKPLEKGTDNGTFADDAESVFGF